MSSKIALGSRKLVPSTQALRCFEAAGRTGSFKAAAEVLHLTPSAISHRIADLEAMLGVPLFERGGRSVRLTEQGAILYPKMRSILQQLTAALDEIDRYELTRSVRLAVAPLFFSRILSGRMAEFHTQNPSISVEALSAADNEQIEAFDCGIRFGSGKWKGCSARKLFDVTIVAVGSPDMLARYRLSGGTDIRLLPVIDTKSSPGSWASWCAAIGLPTVAKSPTTVMSMTDAIAAAKQGMGVCLAVKELIEQELALEQLAIVWGTENSVRSAYWLVQSERRTASPATKVFTKWALSELTDYRPFSR